MMMMLILSNERKVFFFLTSLPIGKVSACAQRCWFLRQREQKLNRRLANKGLITYEIRIFNHMYFAFGGKANRSHSSGSCHIDSPPSVCLRLRPSFLPPTVRQQAVGLPAAAHPDAAASAAAHSQPAAARPGPAAARRHHAVSAARYVHVLPPPPRAPCIPCLPHVKPVKLIGL